MRALGVTPPCARAPDMRESADLVERIERCFVERCFEFQFPRNYLDESATLGSRSGAPAAICAAGIADCRHEATFTLE